MPSERETSHSATAAPPRVLGELRRKVLGWMLLVSLAPMAVITVSSYEYSVQAIVEKTHQHLLSLLNSRQALVEVWVRQHMSELDVLASSPSVARCCAHFAELSEADIDHEVTMMLRAIVGRVTAYEELSVYDGKGTLIARARRPDAGAADAPDAAPPTGPINSPEISAPTAGPDGVTVRITIPANGQGAIVATLNLTRGLDPLMQNRAGMGETGKVYLVTREGAILTAPFADAHGVALRDKVEPEYLDLAAKATPTVTELLDYRLHHVWGCAAPIADTNWLLVAEQDQEEATVWVMKLLRRAIVTGVLALIVVLFVTLWISERLGRPLRDLALVARSIRSGQTEARLGPMRGAEAEEVRRAFNEMLDDLRAKQRQLALSAALASVGELSSSVVHEMRNPLSSIKMNLQALRRRVKGDPDYEELAEIAAGQAQRLETMLDDLLQYGRPVELRPQPTSFPDITNPALAVLADKIREQDVHIELKDALGATRVSVDREHICRAMTNLLVNAIQAGASGQTVRISGVLENGAGPARARLEVADNGPGLTPEALDRAFTPFFTSKQGGTGLGLANVKKIVELHGGTVSAHNDPAGGAVFTITLPAAGPAA